MPSKGTTVYPVRLPDDLVGLVKKTIARRNENTREGLWSFSDFIRIAILEKVKKHERGRLGKDQHELQQLRVEVIDDRLELLNGPEDG